MLATNNTAEWLREKHVIARYGITHMILWTLRTEGLIKSISLARPGKAHGARLYNVASIEAYFEDCARLK